MLETGLGEARLINKRGRTMVQLKLFADLLREGSWVDAVIDTAISGSKRFGADAIRRFVRSLCLQDCPSKFLPEALKNENFLSNA